MKGPRLFLGIVVLMSVFMGFVPAHGLSFCDCDLNHDGRCDMRHWLLFGKNWGRTNCPLQ